MGGEVNNFVLVWITVIASLCYCNKIVKIFPTGLARKLAIFPVICLFVYLPLNLTTIYLGGGTSFFIAWLGSFKLLLFAFEKGPLSSNAPIPLSRFIPLACLPIKFQQSGKYESTKNKKSPMNYVVKIVLLAIFVRVYDYKEHIHTKVIWLTYCLYINFMLEIILDAVGAVVSALAQFEIEPLFDDPYLCTSLQDFWGRRWNLMASDILHATIYDPVQSMCLRLVPRKWAALPAVIAAFLASGLMHELIFYNIGRVKPSGVVMCFFLLHGVCVALEIGMKKMLKGKFALPVIFSRPLALGFVIMTSFWLFFPPLLENKADFKVCTEILAFIEFVKTRKLVDPNNLSCPFF